MTTAQCMLQAVSAITLCLLVHGCGASGDEHAEIRRAELLTIYIPGTTLRAEVQAKWAPNRPDLSEVRPDRGWKATTRQDVRSHVLESERRTGKAVYRCERFWGPDPRRFLGLEYNWFFFDESDVLIDVAWRYHTD